MISKCYGVLLEVNWEYFSSNDSVLIPGLLGCVLDLVLPQPFVILNPLNLNYYFDFSGELFYVKLSQLLMPSILAHICAALTASESDIDYFTQQLPNRPDL